MGFGYSLSQLFKGNPSNAFNGLFVSDDLLAAQDAAGDNLSKIVARQQAEGLINGEQAINMYSQMSPNTDSDAYWATSGATPWQEFEKGISDQAGKIGGLGADAINRTLGVGFKIVPWQIWALGFVLLLIWLYPIWRPFAANLMPRK